MALAILDINYNMDGTGFKARCSGCGKLIRHASGCNRAGIVYAKDGAIEDFRKHKCKSKKTKLKVCRIEMKSDEAI